MTWRPRSPEEYWISPSFRRRCKFGVHVLAGGANHRAKFLLAKSGQANRAAQGLHARELKQDSRQSLSGGKQQVRSQTIEQHVITSGEALDITPQDLVSGLQEVGHRRRFDAYDLR